MTHKPRRTLHGIAAAVAVCALAAPTATAVPAEQFLTRGEDKPPNDSSTSPPPASSIAASAAREYQDLRSPDATTVPVRVIKVRADGGFDWDDAGIGAGSGLALVLIGIGSALALRQRPGRTAPAS
jgi:hypothetical protein